MDMRFRWGFEVVPYYNLHGTCVEGNGCFVLDLVAGCSGRGLLPGTFLLSSLGSTLFGGSHLFGGPSLTTPHLLLIGGNGAGGKRMKGSGTIFKFAGLANHMSKVPRFGFQVSTTRPPASSFYPQGFST